ncbi:MAG: hypothetical protein RLZZ51_1133 [Actinomycetota bacterium]
MEYSLAEAFDEASIPTLLMCLVQITGDESWLREPFLPKRDTNLFADESGGIAESAQQQIRDALVTVLGEISAGQREMPSPPNTELFTKMMSLCVAEEVEPEYAPMMMEAMGFIPRDVSWIKPLEVPHETLADFNVLIIGAGFSGICAAIKLDQLGIRWIMADTNAEIGGTWLVNDYPEAGVDTPNHFYSFTFAPNHRWPRYFSKRIDVLNYCKSVAEKFKVADRISLNTEVVSTTWDEASKTWKVVLRDRHGELRETRANVVISGVGQLNRPKKSFIKGLESFTGPCFHSAQWRHDVDLSGKRVAIIGTGASAMQILRTVASQASDVTIFQRSPQWVRPSNDYHRDVKPQTMWLFENVPFYFDWYRFGLFWRFGDGLLPTLRRDETWPHLQRSMNSRNDKHRVQLTEYLLTQLDGHADLVNKTLPDYPPYGKRILVDNDWYKSLKRENVELVASGVDHIEGNQIVALDGSSRQVDVIILATGFEAGKMLASVAVTGRNGITLRETWGDDNPRAYKGMTMPNFPNLFCLYGPNTNVAHGGSVIFQAECQMRYVTSCITQMIESQVSSVDVRPEVHDAYNKAVDDEHDQLVWSHPGMDSWYKNLQGRIFSPMPWRFVDYWAMTHDADLNDYVLTK